MSRIGKFIICFLFFLPLISCVSSGNKRVLDHALYVCKSLNGPDADKGDGEARYWFETERAKTSRKLWNKRGVAAIDERIIVASSEADKACLLRLRKEAVNRELVEE